MIRQVSKIVRSWSVVGRVFLRTSQLMSSGELHALPDKELGCSLFEHGLRLNASGARAEQLLFLASVSGHLGVPEPPRKLTLCL